MTKFLTSITPEELATEGFTVSHYLEDDPTCAICHQPILVDDEVEMTASGPVKLVRGEGPIYDLMLIQHNGTLVHSACKSTTK